MDLGVLGQSCIKSKSFRAPILEHLFLSFAGAGTQPGQCLVDGED